MMNHFILPRLSSHISVFVCKKFNIFPSLVHTKFNTVSPLCTVHAFTRTFVKKKSMDTKTTTPFYNCSFIAGLLHFTLWSNIKVTEETNNFLIHV